MDRLDEIRMRLEKARQAGRERVSEQEQYNYRPVYSVEHVNCEYEKGELVYSDLAICFKGSPDGDSAAEILTSRDTLCGTLKEYEMMAHAYDDIGFLLKIIGTVNAALEKLY